MARSASVLNRRTFLLASGATAAATGMGLALGPGTGDATASPTAAAQWATGSGSGSALATPATSGTTLRSVAAPRGSGGYRRLADGPGWPRVVRSELAAAKSGRSARRTALACFVQFTDLHLMDVQSPLRFEYLRAADTSGWRPHEALTVLGAAALVERVNALRGGPATGAPIGFVMTTGDNTDNNSAIELEWFLTLMSGGRITPNTGDPTTYEGVQDSGLQMFWQPDQAVRDADRQLGFPHLRGFLDAAIRRITSPGLAVPWYSTVGNHDDLPSGCYTPDASYLADIATGTRKLQSIPSAEAVKMLEANKAGKDPKADLLRHVFQAYGRGARTVTADPRRAPFTPREYVAAHLDRKYAGAGPVGHGYTEAHLEAGSLDYTFKIADDVVGISLDTVDRGGHYQGSLGAAQLRWLERKLEANADASVIVFSHHPSWAMTNLRPDPARPQEKRLGGDELVATLKRHPNVIAWINGHSHKNQIVPHGSFWEVSTASHIDYPQLARVIEVVDNKDGTLSLITTLVESAAPHKTDFTDLSQTGLAALYRELSFNAPGARTTLGGDPSDRNTELLLKKR